MQITDYTLLYAEDEDAIRENYLTFLKKYFLHVYEASDGEEALEIYRAKKPDILLLDINMPKLSGLEVSQIIRQHDQDTKAIMLTAHSDVNLLLNATELNLVKYLIKPITRSDLKNAISLALKRIQDYTIMPNKFIQMRDNFQWDIEKKELFCSASSVKFTKKEQILLSLFMSKPNHTFSHDDIMGNIWDNSESVTVESIKTIIKNLRRKLPKESIENVFGIGYKLSL